ncbi:MAG TPA: imidazole glycerol phosphate synthase subunit HisH [Candidatus Syntrophoarchaeum butanivorans]|uniref:Imidazole glycerol phosphate synthase subunit HisH n=1 Tax=Candidatus Syntropharchaeum butanivorans TaxID=1839936 RepID=A0A1F2P4E7_9EURY|nr:MAG: imidazole glycerol phosphate synthase subunit HisH [Candidatus Syntrophoarchaeum butanivorans]HEC57172.1 imidazole glycerol phosphate synthase subunit HisH [Candidatus Syntrophoarchaeum butanivorans]
MVQSSHPSKRIVIVDYGLGNLKSAFKGFRYLGADVKITDDPGIISDADGIVLPGVGAFKAGMENLGSLRKALDEAICAGRPVLGICLGMQMLLSLSEEGGLTRGLDYIPGRVVRFPEDKGLKIPHMGWNTLRIKRDHPILDGIKDGAFVYFVHSYYALTDREEFTVATTDYGIEFASVVTSHDGKVVGTQFHPEKSGDVGIKILDNFLKMV